MQKTGAILIYSNAWVATCFAMLCLGIAKHQSVEQLEWITVFAFTGTFCSYHLHRMLRLPQLEEVHNLSPRLGWLRKNKSVLNLTFVIAMLLGLFSLFQIGVQLKSLIFLSIVGSIILLYALPLPHLKHGIRTIPGTKIFWITLSWTMLSVFALWNEGKEVSLYILLVVSLSVFVQILPFDMRDRQNDHNSMRTIPQILGFTATKILGSILILIVILIEIEYLGFHYILLLYAICALLSLWIPFKIKYTLILEFLWELPLLILGLSFYIS